MSQQQSRRKLQSSKTPAASSSVSIPDKLYFRIGDVAELCDLQAYVLRYWETEFPQLKPNKGGTGQRLYRKRDVEMVLEIKRLLYTEGFTIAGARRLLAEKRKAEKPEEAGGNRSSERAAIATPRILSRADSQKPAGLDSGVSSSVENGGSVPAPAKPQLSELRREMRELLSLLGAESSERNAVGAQRGKRETKRPSPNREEPTLFS